MTNLANYLPLLLLTMALPSFAGERVDESMVLGNVKNVSIENLRGEVTVIGHNSDTVSVVGELDDKAEGLTFEKSGSRIIIKVEIPHHSRNGGWGIDGSDLTINIPKHARISFKGVSSNINISHFTNGSEIQTV